MINIRRSRSPRWPWFLALALLSACLFLARAFFLYMHQQTQEPPQEPSQEDSAGPYITLYNTSTQTVLEMTLDDYLVGVVAAEMPASFLPEALKAQAVAARTYACRRLSEPCGRGNANLCTDSSCCQAYKDTEALAAYWGEDFAFYMARVKDAVLDTAGEVILYKGELIEALYHAISGGMTEDAQHVFVAAQPYLVSVSSTGEETASKFSAQQKLSRADFVQRVNKSYPEAALTEAKLEDQIKILSRYESGRVASIALGGTILTGRQFRTLFSLNSANFTITLTGEEIKISTIGYGHGVGMSQYGANAMAGEGNSYIEILTHYYTGVNIEKIY